jgi:hypothetical protein
MKLIPRILLLLSLPMLMWRCDREEPIPAYIYIPAVNFSVDSNVQQGSASHKITDAWVTVGGNFLGAYELPAMIPVLTTGNQQVLIRAGVKENGISATRLPYPFYSTFDKNVELKEGKIDTILPDISYDANKTHFDWIEDFETGFLGLAPSSNNSAPFAITTKPDSVFEGQGSLHISLGDTTPYLELHTTTSYILPRGRAVWLEINYKTESAVKFGIISINSSSAIKQFAAGVNPNNEWNKIYFNLSTLVSIQPSANSLRFYIESQKPNDKSSAHILLDNIKLLHFNE